MTGLWKGAGHHGPSSPPSSADIEGLQGGGEAGRHGAAMTRGDRNRAFPMIGGDVQDVCVGMMILDLRAREYECLCVFCKLKGSFPWGGNVPSELTLK